MTKIEKVKCKRCGKEGEIDTEDIMLGQGFIIHWDEENNEYFLCYDCEKIEFSEEDEYPEEDERGW